MRGITLVGSERSEGDETPAPPGKDQTKPIDEKKVRPSAPSPSPGQVVVFPSKTAGPAFTYAPPPPPTPQQIAAGRRRFVKILVTVGALLSLAPYVPWGSFMSSSITSSKGYEKQQVAVDNLPSLYGAAAGKKVNVNDLASFPPNSHYVITYPSSGDPVFDAQLTDTFLKYELIRLPTELGGGAKDASAFIAFSKVCVHLWCSPNYNPTQCANQKENGYSSAADCTKHEQYECPCHGSIYHVPSGVAIAGPASIQVPPTNAIPKLTLSVDSDGFLYIEKPVWDVDHNGVLGYGRYVQ